MIGVAYLQIHPVSEKCYISVKINEVSNWYCILNCDIVIMNCIMKRCSFCDEVAQPHSPFCHLFSIFPKPGVLKLSSPSMIQPQTRLFSTFIFPSKSQNVRTCCLSPLQQFLWSHENIMDVKFQVPEAHNHFSLPGILVFTPEWLSNLQRPSNQLSSQDCWQIFSLFAIFCPCNSSQCLCSTECWMYSPSLIPGEAGEHRGRGAQRFKKKTCTGTKLEFWGLRAVIPTIGSTCRIWGSAAEILMIKTALDYWKLGFSLRSQTEETVESYFFVSRNLSQAFLSASLLSPH